MRGQSPAIATLLLCLLLAQQDIVSALRLKIPLHPSFPALYARELLTNNGSCSDVTEIQRSNLTLYGSLSKLGPDVKFWRSATAKNHLITFENMKVPGLNGETVGEVFDVLRKGHCYPFFLGGSVRDQFLKRVPNDADVEVDCSLATFLKLCVDKWGRDNCQGSPTKSVAHIGNTTVDKDLDVMDIGPTNSTFYVPIYKLEYTVNAMAYDTNGNNVIIDLTGTGTRDACGHLIRIPSRDDSLASWNLWLENTYGVLYRFWKLRSKGLVPFNNATLQFIVENAKKEMQQSPKSFAEFYCHYVFSSRYDPTENKCTIDADKCESGLASAILYERVMSEDLGEYWSEVVVTRYLPSLKDCEPNVLYMHVGHAKQ